MKSSAGTDRPQTCLDAAAPMEQRPDPEIATVIQRLEAWGAAREWVGADPYEGLNSPIARIAPGVRARQLAVQAYKRSPWQPPWPLGPRQRPNSKTLALALSGYATPYAARFPRTAELLRALPRRLERLNLLEGKAGWGYHFDLQTRHLYYFGSAPNAIATVFVVEALLDAHRQTGSQHCLDLALASRPFMLSLFSDKLAADVGKRYFMYVASGSRLVHNANVLVCGALSRLDELDPNEEARDRVAEALDATIAAQTTDGTWPYGDNSNLGWADNFHTAYVLEGLSRATRMVGSGEDALERGLEAWRRRFFDARSAALYYPNQPYPLETHCYASAIDLLSTLERPFSDANAFAHAIARAAIRDLWLPSESRFAFRRTRLGLNRRAFVRWSNAPMFRALTRLCSATR